MKSKASIKNHPIHPILIPFPIAFLTGSFVFDLLSFLYDSSSYFTVGYYLSIAGIAGAVLAAIPGIIDYKFTVPPNSSAKKRAALHGLLNTSMLILFVIAFFIKEDAVSYTVLALEFIGLTLMFTAGWMGGTLAYQNQIGVNTRYANSGKWKEQHVTNHSGLIEVAHADELKTDQMKLLHIGDKRIALAKTEISYIAFNDRCTHKGGSLAGGMMICGTVQCPWHGSQFDVEDGEVKAGPAKEKIDTYKIITKDGKVFIELS